MVLGLGAIVAVAAVAFALASRGGDGGDPPAGPGPAPKATTSARAPLPPVPDASGEGKLRSFAHFRARVPPNWELESEDVSRAQTRLGEARVTTFRPRDDAAPDRVSVLYYASGEFSAKSRVDRREANLKAGSGYHPLQVASTIRVGPHAETIFWTFETDQDGERVAGSGTPSTSGASASRSWAAGARATWRTSPGR